MIKVENLTRTFGPKIAVNGVSFTVERGEVLGFLGPNGAGKSTTMRMITGFIPPTAGRVTVGGFDIVEEPIAAKRLIGYLPENAPSYADMTVRGVPRLRGGAARAARRRRRRRRSHRAVEMCFLETVLHQSDRHAVEGLPAPHLPRAVAHPRSRGADPRRADRRPRSRTRSTRCAR